MGNDLKTISVNSEREHKEYVLPASCCFVITLRCMMKCKMCYIWQDNESGRNELTIQEWKNTVSSLRGILDTKYDIRLSGGEPFLKENLLDLVGFIAKSGYRASLNTNAYLINEDAAKAIRDSGLWRICISLDSLDEDQQDFLRGKKGVYSRVMRAVEYLNKFCPALGINIQTIIMEQNLDALASIAEWVNQDERLDYIYFQAVFRPLGVSLDEHWFKDARYAFLWPDNIDKVSAAIGELIKFKKTNPKIANTSSQLKAYAAYFTDPIHFGDNITCTIGNRDININPYGDIYLCPSKKAIGNVRSDDIGRLWYSSQAIETREKNNQCQTTCHYLLNCCFE